MSRDQQKRRDRGETWAYTLIKSVTDSFIPNQLINGVDPFRRSSSRDGLGRQISTIYGFSEDTIPYPSGRQSLPEFEQEVNKELYDILEVCSPEDHIPDIRPFQRFWDTLSDKERRRWAVVVVAETKDVSISEMLRQIEDDQEIAEAFGFDDGAPSKSTISRRARPEFVSAPPEELVIHLRHWARRQDVEIPESLKPKYGRPETLDSDVLIEEKIGVFQVLVQDLFSEIIDRIGFDRSRGTGNYQYPTSTFYALFAHLAIENSHPTSGIRTFKWENPDLSVPEVGTLYKYIDAYSPETIYQKFSGAISQSSIKLDFWEEEADVAYDTTLIPYHGDDSNEWLVDIGTKDQPHGFGSNPATQAWRFGVISVITEKEQYVLSARLLRSELGPGKHLDDFLGHMVHGSVADINRIVADSQLATEHMIETIQSHSCDYLFYARKTDVVEDLLANARAGECDFRHHIPYDGLTGTRRPHLFISDKPRGDGTEYEEEDHTAYLTNIDPTHRNLRDLAYSYGYRQRVETAIRDVKNTFHAETDSASPSVRSWFFLTACLFYNIHEGLIKVVPGEILPVSEFELTGREFLHAIRGQSFVDSVSQQV